MSVDITNLAVPKTLLSNASFAGANVVVKRFHHLDVPNPVKAEGITLVSFDGLLKHFTDFDQKSGSTDNVFDDLATHAQNTGIDTTNAIAISVHRLSKDDTVVTSNTQYKKNQLMGMAYVSQDYITEEFGQDFTIEDSMVLTIRIDQALRNLVRWQCNDIYKIILSKNDEATLESQIYYDVDHTEGLITNLLNQLNNAA